MVKALRCLANRQAGIALPAVLICMALGGVLIAPSMAFVSSSLKVTLSQHDRIRGAYAAEAGVEDVLWRVKNSQSPRTTLPETPSGMNVTMSTESRGNYTMYAGEWVTTNEHYDWLLVTSNVTWDAGHGAYKYVVTITWDVSDDPSAVIHIAEIGARLPMGYTYETGSTALFGSNLSQFEPAITADREGAQMVNWVFETPRPSVRKNDPTRTQTFYMSGSGEINNNYSWAVAERTDVGPVGELSGSFYTITSIATRPSGGLTARVVANAMMADNSVYIISWRIYGQ